MKKEKFKKIYKVKGNKKAKWKKNKKNRVVF
jgi:hypothetical protein